MYNSIPCGDFELNISHPHGMPTLVPSAEYEKRLDWRLEQNSKQSQGKRERSNIEINNTLPPLAVHLHIYYLETLAILLRSLERCQGGLHNIRLWISTDNSAKAEAIEKIFKQSSIFSQTKVFEICICPNRGRNFGPLFSHLWPELKQESLLLHLHGKQSIENDLGQDWLQQLLVTLLPDDQTLIALRQHFNQDSELGLVMPQPPDLIRRYLNWGNNFELASLLAKPMGHQLNREALLMFPVGGMFWARPAALEPLKRSISALKELPPEPLDIDGSSLHAIERLVAHACESSGHHWRLFCRDTHLTTAPFKDVSVFEPKLAEFQQATSSIANQLRKQQEKLNHANAKLKAASQKIKEQDILLEKLSKPLMWRLLFLMRRMKEKIRKKPSFEQSLPINTAKVP